MYIEQFNSYFIHVPKAGGSSIEKFFFNLAGLQPDMHNVFGSLGRKEAAKWHFGNRVPGLRHSETQHMTVWDCKKFEVKEFLNADYTFSIVRNPWDRFISEVFWKRERLNMKNHTFQDQLVLQALCCDNNLNNNLRPHNTPQWKFIYDEWGHQGVDDVFKLEELDKAEKKLSEVFNTHVKFPHINTTKRNHYDEYLTEDLKKHLYPVIKDDLEIFGYE